MKKILTGAFLLFASIGMSMYVAACSSDGSSTSGSSSTSYSGPGSKWDVSLNSAANTFVITRAPDAASAVDMTVNGTYETTTSGFLKLTVTSASGTDAPTAGAQAYALNVPGFVFLLKPLDANSEIIPMVASGSCPSSSQSFNWMVTSHEASGQGTTLEDNRDLLGTATFNGTDTMSIPAQYDLQGDDITTPNNTITGSCSNGIISLNDGNPITLYLSTAGAGLVDIFAQGSGTATETDDRHTVIVAMPQDTISSLSSLDGNYIGIVFNESVSSGDKTAPVWANFNSAGTTTAGEFTDVDAGTQDPNQVTITGISIDSPANGFFRATLTSGSDTAPMSCQVTKNAAGSGQNIIFCVGIDPDSFTNGNADQLYTVLLVQQN